MVYAGTGIVLLVSLGLAIWARRRSRGDYEDYALGGVDLVWWQIGLSAGATGNSGFVVTAGVALGYLGGTTYCFLPIFWLVGEMLFWRLFSERLRAKTVRSRDKSISGLLTHDLESRSLCATVALVAACGLTLYAASQMVVAQKLLAGGMALTADFWPLALLGVMVSYVLLGGFLSTVWTDVFQAIVMLLLTASCLVGFSVMIAVDDALHFPSFFELVPFQGWSFEAVIAFAATWTLAGAGFGLSQPHVAERYVAARNSQELRRATWLYNGFIQFTWLGMTVVGLLLRSVIDDAGYDESLLITVLNGAIPDLVLGSIVGAMICAVVSTVDSILHAAGRLVSEPFIRRENQSKSVAQLCTIIVAGLVGALFLAREGTVFGLSSLSVAFLTASFAPAVFVRLFSAASSKQLVATSALGAASYIGWYLAGAGDRYSMFFPRFELVPAVLTTAIIVATWGWFSRKVRAPENR